MAVIASILLSFSSVILLKLGSSIGMLLFPFGLYSICILHADLFTGKRGYLWRKGTRGILYKILIANLISGYIMGFIWSIIDPQLTVLALDKIATWNININYFLRSILCGMVMYFAVEMYANGSKVGIFVGVPFFIYCGLQHSIANIIFLGMARTFDFAIVLCIIGNFIGGCIINYLQHRQPIKVKNFTF